MSVRTSSTAQDQSSDHKPDASMASKLAIAWTVVGVPLAYGIYETAKKASALFTG